MVNIYSVQSAAIILFDKCTVQILQYYINPDQKQTATDRGDLKMHA